MREYEEFITNITEQLNEHDNIQEYKDKKIVKETPIHTLFKTHIDMVIHDGVKYWACIIFKSYNKTMSRKLLKRFSYDMGCTDSGVCDDIQEVRDYFEHFGENNFRVFISRLIRENFLTEDALKDGYGFEDALEFIDWFYKILEGIEIE